MDLGGGSKGLDPASSSLWFYNIEQNAFKLNKRINRKTDTE